MRTRTRSRSAGWTLVELLIAIVLVGAVVAKGAMAMHSALELAGDQSASMADEDQARAVMDRIALAVMGSDRDKLLPQVQEIHSDHLTYTFSLGLENGEVVWSAPEEISLSADGHQVEWHENPGAANERKAVWTSLVSPLLQGEIANGKDDNGNGLIDEDGLSFVLDGNRVVIRMTLSRPEVDGHTVEQTVESVVFVRNGT